jgi:hypothetical protein
MNEVLEIIFHCFSPNISLQLFTAVPTCPDYINHAIANRHLRYRALPWY